MHRQNTRHIVGDLLRDCPLSGALERTRLSRVIRRERPTLIIDAINTATIFFGPRAIRHLIRYYEVIGGTLRELFRVTKGARPEQYVKIGTTGTGGMGFNIPLLHEGMATEALLEKVALAGAQTQLLLMLARTPDMPVVKEVKPATAVFSTALVEGKRAGQPCTLVDGGESGAFSPDEFRVVANVGGMEYVGADDVAAVILEELSGNSTGHDVLAACNGALLTPSYRSGVMLARTLQEAEERCQGHGLRCVTTGKLGPKRVEELLQEAAVVLDVLGEYSAMSECGVSETRKRLRRNPRLLAKRLQWWTRQLAAYFQSTQVKVKPHPGDLVAWIFRQEFGGRRTTKD